MSQDTYAHVNRDGSIDGLEASFVEVDGITSRTDGIRTRHYDVGQGDPIVLLHGGNWSGITSANTWSTVIEGLSESFRVLAPDRLGCGITDNPERDDDFVYGTELEHMISFLNTVDADEFHIVGQSRGGGIAARVAAEIPERTKTLVVVNSATLAPHSNDKSFFYERSMRDAPTEEGSATYHRDHYEHLYSMHQYSDHHITDEFLDAAAYMRSRPKAERTAEVLEEHGGQERWEKTMVEHMEETHHRLRTGELQMPTLVYWGRHDPSVPLRAGIGLYELIADGNPQAEMTTINQAGHHPYREYPDEFVEKLTSFVEFREEHGYDCGFPETTYDY